MAISLKRRNVQPQVVFETMTIFMSDEELEVAKRHLVECEYEPVVYAKLRDLESLAIVTRSAEFLEKKRKFATTLEVEGSSDLQKHRRKSIS